MIGIDITLLIIVIAPIVIGAIYSFKQNKRDKLQDWKPHE
jgi:ABC-type spermidine/putrescine transport system permease subunit II